MMMRPVRILSLTIAALLLAITLPQAGFCADQENGHYTLLNDATFADSTAGKLVFVDFYADWCGPCREFAPVFAAVSLQLMDAFFAKVDTDAAPQLSAKYEVRSIPYIVAMRNGVVVAEYRGERTVAAFSAWCRQEMARTGAVSSSAATSSSASSSAPAAGDVAVGTKFTFEGGSFEKIDATRWTVTLGTLGTPFEEKLGQYAEYACIGGFFQPAGKSVWLAIPKKGGMAYWAEGETWVEYKRVVKQ